MEIFSPPVCFDTPHAIARPLMLRDAPRLFTDVLSDPAVMRNIGNKMHTSIDDTKKYIECCERGWNSHFMHMWVVEHKTSGRILGLIKQQAELPRVEVGVISVKNLTLRNRHAFFNMLAHMTDWTITQPCVHYLYVYSDPNSQSAYMAEHCGFQLEARLSNWDSRPNRGLASVPIHLYGVARPFTNLVHFLHYTWFKNSKQASTLLSRSLLPPPLEVPQQSIIPLHSF